MNHRYASTRAIHRQRGTAYVLVLAITTLLLVLGITANSIARADIEENELQEDQVAAQLAAEYLQDYLQKIHSGSKTWRDGIYSSSWYYFTAVDGVYLLHGYVDEIDGDLANDYSQPVRIYTYAITTKARRVYSAEYAPDDEGNLILIPSSMRQETFN